MTKKRMTLWIMPVFVLMLMVGAYGCERNRSDLSNSTGAKSHVYKGHDLTVLFALAGVDGAEKHGVLLIMPSLQASRLSLEYPGGEATDPYINVDRRRAVRVFSGTVMFCDLLSQGTPMFIILANNWNPQETGGEISSYVESLLERMPAQIFDNLEFGKGNGEKPAI